MFFSRQFPKHVLLIAKRPMPHQLFVKSITLCQKYQLFVKSMHGKKQCRQSERVAVEMNDVVVVEMKDSLR